MIRPRVFASNLQTVFKFDAAAAFDPRFAVAKSIRGFIFDN